MSKMSSYGSAFILVGVMLVGCGQNPPAKPDAPATSSTTLTPTPAVETPIKVTPAPAMPTTTAASDEVTFAEAAFLGNDVYGLMIVHPRRLMETSAYRTLHEAGAFEGIENNITKLGIKLESIERALLVIDQASIDKSAVAAGLQPATPEAPSTSKDAETKSHLKQLGLAFQNYLEVYGKYPRVDGDGDGKKTGLSWRVHLLPLVEQGELYEQFHLDEPWDSDHNKTLIAKMPAIFNSPGVTDVGKTSVHVFTGPSTMFDGDQGMAIKDVTDGLSNTIAAVMAGPSTADVWTKPGGLKFDAQAPKQALGDIGDTIDVLLCDGTLIPLSSKLSDATFANLIQRNDGNAVNIERPDELSPSAPVFTTILTLTPGDYDTVVKSLLKGATEEAYAGHTLHANETAAICLVDDKTILCGTSAAVKRLIDTRKSGNAGAANIVKQLETTADLAICVDLQSQSILMNQIVERHPILSLLQQIHGLALQVNLSAKQGEKLLELIVHTASDQMAQTMAVLANSGLDDLKSRLSVASTATGDDAAIQNIVEKMVQSAKINQVESRIELLVPFPSGFDKFLELMKPALKQAREAAQRSTQMNNLKQIAIGFYNHHDAFGRLPGAGSSAAGKTGLSWRVHLLPWLGNSALYGKFNLDEPWDSETNKKLIAEMPDVFKTGAAEEGKTSMHVFTGPGAPFAEDRAPQLRDFVDGASNTILVVEAGPDKAEFWTKPGGLDFDPEDPLKSLGQIAESFNVLLADGTVKRLGRDLKPEKLRRLIQCQDGEPTD